MLEQVHLTTIIDIGIVSLLIYGLFSLIRGTRAVRLVIGVSVLIVVYVLAVAFRLQLLTAILQGTAVVEAARTGQGCQHAELQGRALRPHHGWCEDTRCECGRALQRAAA